jgi:hypothetical protein
MYKKSNTELMPTNGRVIVKIVVPEYSTLHIATPPKEIDIDIDSVYIDGSVNENYPIGARIIAEGYALKEGMIELKNNAKSVINYAKMFKELDDKAGKDFIAKGFVEVYMYSIIREGDVKAIIESEDKVSG